VRRCLAKDPDKRYQSIKDVAIELDELRQDLKSADLDSSVTPSSVTSASSMEGSPVSTDSAIRSLSGTAQIDASRTASSAEYLVSQVTEHKNGVLVGLALLVLVIAGVAFGVYKFAGRKETGSIKSIAVLPFQNKSGDPNSEYLSDGLAESLIYRLSQLPDLKVSPTSSVIRYKGKDTEVSKIASELGVDAVMTGRLAQIGDNLTISVELVDVRNNKLLWGEQYERKMSELLATQREIATAITEKLQLKLSGSDAKGVTKRYTDNNEAYQLYLKGRYYWNKRTVDGLKQAAVYYNQAIEKDPAFALAYSGLAETYVLYPNYSVASPKDSMPRSKAAALKALEIDDSLAEPHAALGLYYTGYAWNLPAAEKELRRAIELNPNYATAYHWLGVAPLVNMQRFDEAVAAGKRAEELDPLSVIISADQAYNLLLARRYDEAIAQGKQTLLLDPNFYYTHYLLGWAYLEKGMYREAIVELRKSIELNEDPFAKALLIQSLAKSGERAEAAKLRDELKSESTRRYIPNYFLAMASIALGDKDEAFALLEKDIAERSAYVTLIGIDPLLDDLRGDPRFGALMQKVASAKID
jgi:TolB-like protein/Flp pilus assembly protein TadD